MNFGHFLLSLLFPEWCCGCGSYGELLCKQCFEKLEFTSEINTGTRFCSSIQSVVSYSKVSAAIIHELKYSSIKKCAMVCANILYLYSTFPSASCITSVPLHITRQRQRGFNQSEEIARHLSPLLDIPYIQPLKRVKHAENLAGVTSHLQRKNIIRNQFVLEESYREIVREKDIIVIDDVWTTGSTLEEVAKVLLASGATNVHGVTFAHRN